MYVYIRLCSISIAIVLTKSLSLVEIAVLVIHCPLNLSGLACIFLSLSLSHFVFGFW